MSHHVRYTAERPRERTTKPDHDISCVEALCDLGKRGRVKS